MAHRSPRNRAGVKRAVSIDRTQTGTRAAVDQHLDIIVADLEYLPHIGNDAIPAKVAAFGVFDRDIILGHQKNGAVVLDSPLDRRNGLLTTDIELCHSFGEQNQTPHRNHRNGILELFLQFDFSNHFNPLSM